MEPVDPNLEWILLGAVLTFLSFIIVLLKLPTWLKRRRKRLAHASGLALGASTGPTVPLEPRKAYMAQSSLFPEGVKIRPWRESMAERMAKRDANPEQWTADLIAAGLLKKELPEIGYEELALVSDKNILIVGPKKSGKTTLLRRIIAMRDGYVEAFDPHNEPGKWPCEVVGGGERFDAIMRHLKAVYATMQDRYKKSDAGWRSQDSYQEPDWTITLVGDEWGGIVSELPSRGKSQLGAGAIQGKLLARGRKAGITLLVAAHDDTAAQVGLEGEMGLMGCYDYIVYLGAQATSNTAIPKEVREEAREMERPAVVLSSDRQEWFKFSYIDLEPHMRGDLRWYRPADYAEILDTSSGSDVLNGAGTVPQEEATVANAEQTQNEPQNAVLARSDAVEQKEISSVPPVPRSQSDAELLAKALQIVPIAPAEASPPASSGASPNANAGTNADPEAVAESTKPEEASEPPVEKRFDSPVVTPEEMANVVQAIMIYNQNGGRKADAICKAFGVTRGGGFAYQRAKWLVGDALDRMKTKNGEERDSVRAPAA